MNKIKIHLGIFAAVIFALFLVSINTSPLYPNAWGSDSATYILFGKGLLNGKLLYTDLFDHKGPILFFIQAVGYLFGGVTGVFIIQCINLYIFVLIMYNTSQCISDKKSNVHVVSSIIAGVILFLVTLRGGNRCEEYSLIPIALSFNIFFRFIINPSLKNDKHPCLFAFLYGVSFMFIALIKLNNSITILCCVFCVSLYLLYRKRFKNLLFNLLYGLAGMAVIAIPIFMYFILTGTFYDMIYATFIHNFLYTGAIAHRAIFSEHIFRFIFLYAPVVLAFMILLKYQLNKRNFTSLSILFVCFANMCLLMYINLGAYYFIIFAPVFIVTLFYFPVDIKLIRFNGETLKRCLKPFSIFFLVMLAVYVTGLAYQVAIAVNDVLVLSSTNSWHETISRDVSCIPKEERDSVIGFNLSSADYLSMDIMPCYKYYAIQDWLALSNPAVKMDFLNFLVDKKPLWVLTRFGEYDKAVLSILQDYEVRASNEFLVYYRKKDL